MASAAWSARPGRPGATRSTFERLLAPITNPGKIFGSGVNYRSHGDEEPGYVFPDEPCLGLHQARVGHHRPRRAHRHPAHRRCHPAPAGWPGEVLGAGFAVDYEVEFGVVMGKAAKHVRAEDALDHILGYTLFNDVGSRSVQFHNGQRDLAKNFDTFCPMGPWIVTRDELPDWGAVRIQAHVNGELRQSALVHEQIAPPPVAIEWISSIIRLEPGRLPDDRHPGGLWHVHGAAPLPDAGGRRDGLGDGHRRADQSGRRRDGQRTR